MRRRAAVGLSGARVVWTVQLRRVQGHDNVVRLLALEESTSSLFLVLEMCKSDVLSEVVARERLDVRAAGRLFAMAVRGVPSCR